MPKKILRTKTGERDGRSKSSKINAINARKKLADYIRQGKRISNEESEESEVESEVEEVVEEVIEEVEPEVSEDEVSEDEDDDEAEETEYPDETEAEIEPSEYNESDYTEVPTDYPTQTEFEEEDSESEYEEVIVRKKTKKQPKLKVPPLKRYVNNIKPKHKVKQNDELDILKNQVKMLQQQQQQQIYYKKPNPNDLINQKLAESFALNFD